MNAACQRPWIGLLLFIIPFFIVLTIFSLLGYAFAGIEWDGASETVRQKAIIYSFVAVGIVGLIFFFQKYYYQESILSLGFSLQKRGPDFSVGLLMGICAMAIGAALLLFTGQATAEIQSANVQNLMYLFLLFLWVALYEEILFRGFIQAKLMDSMHGTPALLMAALVFAVFHLGNPNITLIAFLNLFLAGILLGLPYLFTRNLWLPVSLHFSWNFFQSLFGFRVSGLDTYSFIELSLPEDTIWNGGLFGFEGSLICTLMILLLCALTFVYLKMRKEY
ncbi:type II CAAX endopeptidase family protein [Balneolaceae bacterium ANBcel3]|nr:type II CAAX endopeptidase family protein [Balneolaceae bacterium ANBcel3]